MLIIPDEVVTGAVVNAIAVAGRRISAALARLPGRRAEDLDIAQWFETFRLTESVPDLPDLAPALTGELAAVLGGDEIQAALQELLAARLTDAPEAEAARAREVIALTLTVGAPGAGPAAGVLAGYYDDQICALVARLGVYEPAALAQIRAEAFATRMVAILEAIERHTAALTARPGHHTEASFLSSYRSHVTDQHGKLEPPDFERRRRVPIRDIYVPAVITEDFYSERAVVSPPADQPSLDVYYLAARLDRSVLLGDPGSGKTTAANVLMHYFASQQDGRVPFLVTLRDYAANDPPERSVVGHVEHILETFYQCPAPPGLVHLLLLTGRAVVIFDGLDELLDTSRRADVTDRVEHFCAEYPLAPVLVTSRVIGYDQARLDDLLFTCYRLGGFDDAAVIEYARGWFAQDAEAGHWDTRAFISESASVPDLRSNPLMLALLCILYRGEGSLPRNRAEVYEQCAIMLYRRWDTRRRIHQDLRASRLIEPTLRHLAWWLFTRDHAQPAVTERELTTATTGFLYGRGFESADDARAAAVEFVEFCRGRMWVFSDAGTTASGEPLYTFTHRTFLEYFAAAQLAYDSDTPGQLADKLVSRVAREQWWVVAELALQIKDRTSNGGASRVYASLLDGRDWWSAPEERNVLRFLSLCLRSVDPSPQRVRDLTRRLAKSIITPATQNTNQSGLPPPRPELVTTQVSAVRELFANCAAYADIVDDEIAAAIEAAIMSGDRAATVNSLHLTVWLGDCVERYPEKYSWWSRMKDILRAHAAEVTVVAEEDHYIRDIALRYGLISVSQALEMPGGLTVLFRQSRSRFPSFGLFPYLQDTYLRLLQGWPAFAGSATAAVLQAVGEYLRDQPELPWVDEYIGQFHGAYDGLFPPADGPGQFGPIARLGGAAILAIMVESDFTTILDMDPRRLGPLCSLLPYLQRRHGGDRDAELPDLPVPEEFGQVFRDWAEGLVNFTKPGKGIWKRTDTGSWPSGT